MPASFGKPIWQAAKQLPKVHWSSEPEQFQLGRPDVCNDAVLILLTSFVGPKWAWAMYWGTHCNNLAGSPDHLARASAHSMEMEGDLNNGVHQPF